MRAEVVYGSEKQMLGVGDFQFLAVHALPSTASLSTASAGVVAIAALCSCPHGLPTPRCLARRCPRLAADLLRLAGSIQEVFLCLTSPSSVFHLSLEPTSNNNNGSSRRALVSLSLETSAAAELLSINGDEGEHLSPSSSPLISNGSVRKNQPGHFPVPATIGRASGSGYLSIFRSSGELRTATSSLSSDYSGGNGQSRAAAKLSPCYRRQWLSESVASFRRFLAVDGSGQRDGVSSSMRLSSSDGLRTSPGELAAEGFVVIRRRGKKTRTIDTAIVTDCLRRSGRESPPPQLAVTTAAPPLYHRCSVPLHHRGGEGISQAVFWIRNSSPELHRNCRRLHAVTEKSAPSKSPAAPHRPAISALYSATTIQASQHFWTLSPRDLVFLPIAKHSLL
nr:hypothetical protein Iba_chr07aCG6590 [Ipomoea batatas]